MSEALMFQERYAIIVWSDPPSLLCTPEGDTWVGDLEKCCEILAINILCQTYGSDVIDINDQSIIKGD